MSAVNFTTVFRSLMSRTDLSDSEKGGGLAVLLSYAHECIRERTRTNVDATCVICMETDGIKRECCNMYWCDACASQWIQTCINVRSNPTCPTCRRTLFNEQGDTRRPAVVAAGVRPAAARRRILPVTVTGTTLHIDLQQWCEQEIRQIGRGVPFDTVCKRLVDSIERAYSTHPYANYPSFEYTSARIAVRICAIRAAETVKSVLRIFEPHREMSTAMRQHMCDSRMRILNRSLLHVFWTEFARAWYIIFGQYADNAQWSAHWSDGMPWTTRQCAARVQWVRATTSTRASSMWVLPIHHLGIDQRPDIVCTRCAVRGIQLKYVYATETSGELGIYPRQCSVCDMVDPSDRVENVVLYNALRTYKQYITRASGFVSANRRYVHLEILNDIRAYVAYIIASHVNAYVDMNGDGPVFTDIENPVDLNVISTQYTPISYRSEHNLDVHTAFANEIQVYRMAVETVRF